jgi:hypothetical protein
MADKAKKKADAADKPAAEKRAYFKQADPPVPIIRETASRWRLV